jgi:hypothetical protein
MSIRQEHLAALCDLGYSEQEAGFVYLVATHSGYFTLQQYLDFTGTKKGWRVHQFTEKSSRLGHLRSVACAYGTALYNLYSRRVYGALDRDNLRNRRRLSTELIRTRLSILDFVIAHPDLEYLETEADKVACFRGRFAIPDSLIPGRIYQGMKQPSTTKRCFVDRFPIYLSSTSKDSSPQPTPVFVYCDSAPRSLLYFITYLRNYEHFLRRLSSFEIVYAAPSATKFERAERFFRGMFEESSATNARSIARYFRLRRLWEEEKHDLLTRADRDFLRHGNQRYRDQFWESEYRKWADGSPGSISLDAMLGSRATASNWTFRTYLLPHQHQIFLTGSAQESGTNSPEECSASRSESCSAEESRKHF